MQIVPIKVSNVLQRIYHEIDSQISFLNFEVDLAINVLPVIRLTFFMLDLHSLSPYWIEE